MREKPLVSVIMTVYNGEQYIAQALNSIRHQRLSNWELIVVDDGSNDKTPKILAEVKAADPRITIITKPRLGRAKALNVAWTHSKGIYVANLDADDLAEPDRLEKQAAFLQQHPEVGLLGTTCKVLNHNSGKEYLKRLPLTDPELRKVILQYDPFVHSAVMVPRHALEKVGGYDERYDVAIDYDLWLRLIRHYQVANLPDVLTIKRVHKLAYFRTRIPRWKRSVTLLVILWRAWRRLSRPMTELRFVICKPTKLWLQAWGRIARYSIKRLG